MYSLLSDNNVLQGLDIDLNKSAEGGSSETVDIDSDGEGFDLVHARVQIIYLFTAQNG